jgi:hypothetical protein
VTNATSRSARSPGHCWTRMVPVTVSRRHCGRQQARPRDGGTDNPNREPGEVPDAPMATRESATRPIRQHRALVRSPCPMTRAMSGR